jgi:hypothetical protein
MAKGSVSPQARSAAAAPAYGPMVSPDAPSPFARHTLAWPGAGPSTGRRSGAYGRNPTRHSATVAPASPGPGQRRGQQFGLAARGAPVVEPRSVLADGTGHHAAWREGQQIRITGPHDHRPGRRIHPGQVQVHDLAAAAPSVPARAAGPPSRHPTLRWPGRRHPRRSAPVHPGTARPEATGPVTRHSQPRAGPSHLAAAPARPLLERVPHHPAVHAPGA